MCPLTRTSVVKASLDKSCINDVLKRILQETVVKARNFTYIAALFMNYLVIKQTSEQPPISTNQSNFLLPSILPAHTTRQKCARLGKAVVCGLCTIYTSTYQRQLSHSYCFDIRLCKILFHERCKSSSEKLLRRNHSIIFSADFRTNMMIGFWRMSKSRLAKSSLFTRMVKLLT